MSTLASSFCPQQTHPPPLSPPPSSSAAAVPAALRLPGRRRFNSSSSYSLSLSPSLFFPRQRLGFNGCSCGSTKARRFVLFVAASASSFDELHAKGRPRRSQYKNSVLLNLIQEIEPLDVALIQKDVPANTIDAMKRTISSMLGLLPSDQFRVLVEAFWEPLSKLLISSIMTGYTLRNAEYRLCLERNLDIYEEASKDKEVEHVENASQEQSLGSTSTIFTSPRRSDLLQEESDIEQPENMELQGLGEMTSEVKEYIQSLQSELSSMKKELCDIKRKNSALEMQHFVGEEKNDLLDYLRSLQPDKVVELSESTCPEVQEVVHSIVHGLLATLSPKMHSKAPPPSENAASGTLNDGKDDCPEVVENTSIHYQPLISLSRDYLARLLFWCMLLGHYLRGLEYRLELMQLLALPNNVESIFPSSDQVS